MGLLTYLKKMKKGSEEAKLLVLGLDNAGNLNRKDHISESVII